LKVQLDHVALGLPRAQDAEPFLEGVLRGVPTGGYDHVPFGFRQWVFAQGGRIEVIYPLGPPGGFVHRFLAAGGPRIHHVTFKVGSLDEMTARARALGFAVVSEDRSDPHWQEAFLHPKSAQGIVVQLVEHRERAGEPDWADPAPRPDAVRVRGPRLAARDAALARRLWGELLGGRESRRGEALVFAWPESPLVITVDIDPSAEPGPRCIELGPTPPLELPSTPIEALGTRFVQRA
jgi:hypothetical protein